MTLEQLEKSLPNGLHDAEVQRITVDYAQRKLTMELAIWVGNVGDPPESREAYKNAQLEISGLLFLVMEPPDPRYPFNESTRLTVDGCDMSSNIDRALLQALPENAFFRSLWVSEWNAFIHIGAQDAQLSWIGETIELKADT